MTNTPRLTKSGIEYLDYSWGIFSGCHNHLTGICGGGGKDFNCWAQSIAYRFPNHYPRGFNPTYYAEAVDSPKHLKNPARIGVGWVGDVIGYGLQYKEHIYTTIKACPQHTFLFLTKNPEELPKWEKFPENCWVGVTVNHDAMLTLALTELGHIEATVKFLSIEPLQGSLQPPLDRRLKQAGINWVIIGAQTKPYKPPKVEWVQEIVNACDKAGVAVFLKENLKPLLNDNPDPLYHTHLSIRGWKLRQELPK